MAPKLEVRAQGPLGRWVDAKFVGASIVCTIPSKSPNGSRMKK